MPLDMFSHRNVDNELTIKLHTYNGKTICLLDKGLCVAGLPQMKSTDTFFTVKVITRILLKTIIIKLFYSFSNWYPSIKTCNAYERKAEENC